MLKRKIVRWFGNIPFARKIFFTFMAVFCITLLPLGSYSYYQAKKNLISQEKQNVKEQIWQANIMLDSQIKLYQSVLSSILYNVQIRQCLEEDDIGYFDQYVMFSNILEPIIGNILSANGEIIDLKIYTNNRTLQNHSKYLYALECLENYEEQINRELTYQIKDGKLIAMCKYFRSKGGYTHILRMEFRIKGSLDMLFEKGYLICLIQKNGNVIFKSEGIDECEEAWNENKEFGLVQLAQDSYYLIQNDIKEANWKEYCFIPKDSLAVDVTEIVGATVVQMMLAAIFCVLISSRMGKKLTVPLNNLQENIKLVENGNFTNSLHSEYTDEIGNLTNAFGKMTEKLNVMVNEVYASEIARRKAEFKMLQAQMNPHFLYNTLSFINWSALRAGQKEIAKISRDISTYYRTALNAGKMTTVVKEELLNAKSYVDIQLALHHYNFDVEYDIDEESMEQEIICNILQPLIENALEHGIDKKRSGRGFLKIVVKKCGENLLCEVMDNGPGFEGREMEKLLISDSKGYGLKNVNERIHIYYGKEYGIELDEQDTQMTRIKIILPFK